MTRLDARRPLRRHLGAYAVELTPAGIRIRERGRSTWLGPVSYGRFLVMAARLTTEARRPVRRHRRRPLEVGL